jgi:hypothetical protein
MLMIFVAALFSAHLFLFVFVFVCKAMKSEPASMCAFVAAMICVFPVYNLMFLAINY